MEKAERSKDILENLKRFEQRSFSVFVDYLSHKVNVQWLWNVFSRVGQVVDVYISRKIRKNNPTRFAFVRFEFRNHASRAIQLLNGSLLDGKTIAVSESKYGRKEVVSGFEKYQKKHVGLEINHNESNGKCVSKADCDVKGRSGMSYKDVVVNNMKEGNHCSNRRKIEVSPSQKQQELLRRSILAESVKPIKFGSVVQGFKMLAKDFGRLECRDLGPSKCIISFDSVELRDKALTGPFMQEFFDVVKPFCGFKWSISRRVWLEVMGLPIHVWSEDTFVRLAKGLDGRLVKQHELTEEGASFSVAKILIDYYRWEPIQEWISVICEDAVFDVYVKECGGEVLSLQVHPEDSVQNSGSCSTCRVQESKEEVDVSSPEKEETMLEKDGDKVIVRVDPLMEGIINASWKFEQAWGRIERENFLDPMHVEAQIKSPSYHDYWGLEALYHERDEVDEDQISASCSFPPGFGPCTKENHVDKEIQSGDLANGLVSKNNKDLVNNVPSEESDDELLKNLVERSGNKKKVGDSRPKKNRAPQTQKILLGSSKRIFQSRFGLSKKQHGGSAAEVRSENSSEDQENNESEESEGDIKKAKETKYICEVAGMNFKNVDDDKVLKEIINISKSRRR